MMKKNLDKKFFGGAVFVATMAAAMLAACGGGGDGGTTPASSDPIDKYLGTYTVLCQKESGVTDAQSGQPVYQRRVHTFTTKVSTTKATGTAQITYYDKNDCSGSARYTVNLTTADNFLNIDGSATIGAKAVDKVTGGVGVYFPGMSFGNALTINGLTFRGEPYNQQKPSTSKDILWLDSQGALFAGDLMKPLDAQGYPTALEATPSLTFKPR